MSKRLVAALALVTMIVALAFAGCGNEAKDACDPDKCAPVKCPQGDRRGCIDNTCVTDSKVLCTGET